ncbi:MAG: MATE family efflux transporter [Bacteroidales bacterium]|nr:MATE family efflux transporter [Bacteroidales bacterium]
MRKEILKLALPNILSNISVPLLGLVDLALMGHLDSEIHLNAIAIGGVIFSFIYLSFGFLRMGTTGFTAQAYGQGNEEESVLILSRSLLVSFAIALLLVLSQELILFISFQLLESSSEVLSNAKLYFSIRIYAAPATLGLYAISGWFIGRQNTKIPLLLALVINFANLGFNLLFVRVFEMKSDGVAWGTLLAQYLGFLIGLSIIALRYRSNLRLWNYSKMLDGAHLRAFFHVNRDIFIRTIVLISSLSFFTSASAKLGETVLAVNTLLFQFFLFFSYFIDGFANAAEALVGKYIGLNKPIELKRVIRKIMWWGLSISLPFSIGFFFFAEQLISILTDLPNIIQEAKAYFIWIAIVPLVSFAAFIYDGIYIGATQAKAMRNSMFFASLLGYLPLFYLLNPLLGNHGLWIAFLAFLGARGLLLWLWERKFILNRKI